MNRVILIMTFLLFSPFPLRAQEETPAGDVRGSKTPEADCGAGIEEIRTAYRLGDDTGALARLRSLLPHCPDALEAHLIYQEILMRRQEGGRMIAEYRRLYDADPKRPLHAFLLANALTRGEAWRKGEAGIAAAAEAELLLSEAESALEHRAEFWHTRARLAAIRKEKEAEGSLLEKAFALDPGNDGVARTLLTRRLEEGKIEEARKICETVLAISPPRYAVCGALWMDRGKPTPALLALRHDILERIEARLPQDRSTLSPLELFEIERFYETIAQWQKRTEDRFAEAAESWAQLLRERVPSWEPRARNLSPREQEERLGRRIMAAARYPKLDERIARLEALQPEVEAFPHMATRLYQILMMTYLHPLVHAEEKAAAMMEKLLEIDPDDPELLNEIAYTLAEQGKHLDRALSLITRAIERLEENRYDPQGWMPFEAWRDRIHQQIAYYLDTRGWIHLKMEHYSKAIADLRIAAKLVEDGTITYHLGLAYEKDGQREAAFETLIDAVLLGGEEKENARKVLARLFEGRYLTWPDLDAFLAAEGERRKKGEEAPKPQNPLIGKTAPDFEVETLGGEKVRLSALRGKIVVLDFWATWCGPCREEFPILEKLHREFQEKGVVFLALSTDDEPEKVPPFVKAGEITMSVAMADDEIESAYGISGIPALFLVDPSGTIRHFHEGYHPEIEEKLRQEISALQ